MKIGVLGAGHLGKIHLKCIKQIEELELVGFYDVDEATRNEVSKDLDVASFEDSSRLIEACDIVDIVTPTTTHFDLAKQAILSGKHVFIEKPVTETIEQAAELIRLQNTTGVKVQIGHVERFNPAYLALRDVNLRPRFIEGHRLANFNPRGTDVSVVLDLMIHDLDLILQLMDGEVVDIQANGVCVVSPTPDICNARLTFENGSVANITASRISMDPMRKLRIFQADAYIALNMLKKEAQIFSLKDNGDEDHPMILETGNGRKWVDISIPKIKPNNAILSEIRELHEAITNDTTPAVTLSDGYRALELAHKINERCIRNQ